MKYAPPKLTLLSVSTGALLAFQLVPTLASHIEDIDRATLISLQGFRIDGAAADIPVSFFEDLDNYDGIDDIIIGAHSASPSGHTNVGSSYVIFGKDGGYIDLASSSSTRMVSWSEAAAGDHSGISASSVGDTNKDGIIDLLIDIYGASPSSLSPSASPSYSSSSTHNVPWYSPAKWFSSLKEWWHIMRSNQNM